MKNEEPSIDISVEEGERLKQALLGDYSFIEISSRDITVRANTIDRVIGQYKALEDQCMMCGTIKPISTKCPRGCDEPNTKNREAIKNMGKMIAKKMPEVTMDESVPTNCQACDVEIEDGKYCDVCKELYD